MLQKGILNPALLSLIARVRHTNYLVIADRGFPYWPALETVDISLVDGIPTVVQVLSALRPNFVLARAFMAEQFRERNVPAKIEEIETILAPAPIIYEPHLEFKKRVPQAIGLIRTADTTSYGNIILESA